MQYLKNIKYKQVFIKAYQAVTRCFIIILFNTNQREITKGHDEWWQKWKQDNARKEIMHVTRRTQGMAWKHALKTVYERVIIALWIHWHKWNQLKRGAHAHSIPIFGYSKPIFGYSLPIFGPLNTFVVSVLLCLPFLKCSPNDVSIHQINTQTNNNNN